MSSHIYNETNDFDTSGINVIVGITSFFLVILFIYLIGFISHIITNLCSKGPSPLIHWIDFGMILLNIIAFLLLYIIHLRGILSTGEAPKCENNLLCLNLNALFYMILCILLTNNLFNTIQGIQLCFTINKIVNINATDVKSLTTQLNKINITKTTKRNRHIVELIILTAVNVFFYVFLTHYREAADSFRWKRAIYYSLLPLFMAYLIFEFLVVYFLKFYKKKILENNYYSSNLIMLAIYNLNMSKIVFFNEFLTYKSIIDFVSCFPYLMFFVLGSISLLNWIITLIVYTIYLLIIGAIYLYVDKTNKLRIKRLPRIVFMLNCYNFNFGEKEKAKLFDEYLLDWNTDESRLLGDLNVSKFQLDPVMELETNPNNKLMKGYLSVNFYLIYKLLHEYYSSNKEAFHAIEEGNDTSTFNENEMKNLLSNIKKKITCPSSSFLNARDDLNYCDEFHTNYITQSSSTMDTINRNSVHNQNLSSELVVESLYCNKINKLLPAYRIKVADIIESLNPKCNYTLSNTFWNIKSEDRAYNHFYSHDNLLMFEIYDYEDESLFLSKKQIETFVDEYIRHFSKIIAQKKKTFLPFILGIFKISYYDYSKLIIVSKSSVTLNHFPNIANTSLIVPISEIDNKIIKISGEAGNNGEEIKNEIKLNKAIFTDIISTLGSDIELIDKLTFVSFFKINLLIIQEGENDSSNAINESDSISSKNVFSDNSNEHLKHCSYPNGTQLLTNYEQVLHLNLNSPNYLVKIFLSELFRINIDPSLKEIIKGDTNSNKTYKKFLQHQLIKNHSSDSDQLFALVK